MKGLRWWLSNGCRLVCWVVIATALVACSKDAELPVPPGGGAHQDASSDVSLGGSGGGSPISLVDSSFPSDAGVVVCVSDGSRCVYAAPDAGPYCGDGIVNQASEECDDGNVLPGD